MIAHLFLCQEKKKLMKINNLTEDIVAAHAVCNRKSFKILFEQDTGKEQNHVTFLRERKQDIELQFFQSKIKCLPFVSDKLEGKAEIILNATIKTGSLVVKNVHLQKCETNSKLGGFSYEPLIFLLSNNLKIEDRTVLSYIGHVLHKAQGVKPKKAVLVFVDGSIKSTNLNKDIHFPIINELQEWINSKPELPSYSFNKHCSSCQFEQSCLTEAEKEDSISLLGNMSPKVQKKFESKGIFTIKQLSYIYKPRRRSKHWGDREPTHQYELQALALRTKEIYTTDLLELPKGDIEIFIDIESIPEQRFHYLIGILVAKQETQQFYSLWADAVSEEIKIWERFIEIVESYPSSPIFHYGSYDKKVITELAGRHSREVDDIVSRLCNVNKYIYGRIYFPTRTNGLKDICNYLGFSWTEKGMSGLDSIVRRYDYDKTHCETSKNDLVLYNQEDCVNLKKLKNIVNDICLNNSVIPNVKAVNNKNQLLSSDGNQVVNDFSELIKSAHGSYEQSKITLGKKHKKKGVNKKSNTYTIPKSKIDKEVRVPRKRVCPVHHCALIPTELKAENIILDLVCTPKGIKRTIIKYWGYKGRCPYSSHRYSPSSLTKNGKNTKYGDGLKAWVTYQRMVMRLPLRKITQLLEDTFSIVIASGGINSLLQSVSNSYIKSEKIILKAMLQSPKIHADETLVNIQGKNQYVWVFTDGDHVIFRLTETRDSLIVHQILKGYKGVLISDFFSGYDAVECHQQKCWVHLIRDINEDIRNSPFDLEYEMFVLALRELIIPIFDAVEKYGLKKRNLNKFQKEVERFYKKNIDGQVYKSDNTKKYQKRFSRYRSSLFVFLEHDGVPWNNNMAERALRHLAVQRKISGSFFVSGMTNYLILLGIMQTCRFQNKPFLEFLMSGEKDINTFKGKKNIMGWEMN